MDFKQLHSFSRIAELGSFSKASLALDIAQPALSRQIRLLETEIGAALFIRHGRGVRLTERGRLMLDHARGIIHQCERAMALVRSH
jgi:LysR family transcriptional regulator, nitrogen assimilation regulatory protein